MQLTSGTRLGPYEIVSRLGAGGMGEVYRARDTRLDRSVAIKVLPSELAADPQLKLRFEREARAISQLNHPNICTLHDVGDGYLVMELLEGETLAARIARGALPPGEVFRIGAQIADALHRAHRAGIVHRDLKPANIMLTKSGAKLLDFGLAKPAGITFSADATTMQAAPLTEQGMILGTFQYMAPEQLEGLEADPRTDIFALGALLYEMATGKRAFDGSSRTSIIAAIVTGQPPPMSTVQPLVPAALEHVVNKCLEKDREDRWQSAQDVAEQLRFLSTSSGAVAAREVVVPPARRRAKQTVIAAALIAAFVAGALAGRFVWQKPSPAPSLRYVAFSGFDWMPAASPDGKSIAFASVRDGKSRIWIKQLNGGAEAAITAGSDTLPRFSPDGSTLLFVRDTTTLYRVAAVGGEPRKIAENAFEGDWSPDGQRIAFLRFRTERGRSFREIFVADANGGNERRIYSSQGWGLFGPRFSPDGKTLAATTLGTTSGSIELVDVAGGTSRRLDVGGSPTATVWLGNDVIVYGRIRTATGVQAAPGEIVRHDLRSGETKVLLTIPNLGGFIDRIGENRLIVETLTKRSNLHESSLRDVKESAWRTRGNTTDRQPAFSPDGEWIIFSSDRSNGNLDIWALSRKTGAMRQLTDDAQQDWDPQYTPDGKHILWSSDRTGHFEIWKANADGSLPTQVSNDGADAENPTQAPNGDIYYASHDEKRVGLWRIDTKGVTTRIAEGTILHPEVSPDGEYVAYHVTETEEVLYVLRPRDKQLMRFATGFGMSSPLILTGRARWMPGGPALAFIGETDGKFGVYVQDFEFGRDTQATRRPLAGFDWSTPTESFGITPDGSAVVLSLFDDNGALTLVENLPLQ